MDFTIYVLGDVRLFADTLNGIAMIFTVANGESMDIWASNTNSMGLGMGAFMGAILAICSLIYNAAFRQKFDFAALILPLIIYICLTVPKVTVNVVDGYYRDGAQSVDNVPLGLALPMSAISTIAFNATEKLETVFTVPNNGTYSKITEDGFMMPLKVLHALRYTGLTMRDGFPNMSNTLVEAVKICLTNNPTFNLSDYQNSTDSLGVLYKAMNDGGVGSRLVKIYPYNEVGGKISNCSLASEHIKGTLQAYARGTVGDGDLPSLIAGTMLEQKNLKTDIEKILATQNGNTGSRNLTDTSTTRVLDEIQNFTKVSNTEALNFVQASLLNPQLSTVSKCVNGADNSATARCLSYQTAEEQWKERSAAEASGFLGIMRDGQNLLILLSITLFPIMILVIVFQGMGGLKVVMSYFLYTISAYMWIPVAAMINWFSQAQMHEEMQKWMSRLPADVTTAQGFISLANAPLFYDALTKRLSVANNVMAAVPVICMGIFGGMLWSMNRLVDKMNPQSDFAPSTNTPDVLERSAISSVGSSISFDGTISTGTLNALADNGSLQRVKEKALAHQKANETLDKAENNAIKAIGELIANSKDSSIISTLANDMSEQFQFSAGNGTGRDDSIASLKTGLSKFGLASKFDQGNAISDQEVKAASAALNMDVKVGTKDENAKIAAALRNSGRMALARAFDAGSGDENGGMGAKGDTGQYNTGWNTTANRTENSKYAATSALIATTEKVATESDSVDNSLKNSNTFTQTLKQARSDLNTYSEQDRQASSMSINTEQLANTDKSTGGQLSRNLEPVWEKYKNDPSVQGAYENSGAEYTSTSGVRGGFTPKLHALLGSGNRQAAQDALSALGGVGAYLGGNVNGDHINKVNPNANQVRGNVEKNVAGVSALTTPNTSASQIQNNAADIEGDVAASQASTDAKARQTPHVRGALNNYEGQNSIQRESFVDEVGGVLDNETSNLTGGKTVKMPTSTESAKEISTLLWKQNDPEQTNRWGKSKNNLNETLNNSYENHRNK